MKTMKALCTATILALALSIPAHAGEISTPGAPNPNPPPATAPLPGDVQTPTSPGEISTPGFVAIFWGLFSLL